MGQLELFNRFGRLQVSEALSVYWEIEGKDLKGKSHAYDLKRIGEHWGRLWLDEVTKYDVKSYRIARKLDNPDLRESSLNKEHGRITRIFNAFDEWKETGTVKGYDFSGLELPIRNPGAGVQMPSEAAYRRKIVIEPDEFIKWLDYAHPEIRKIATIAVLTLLRRKDISLLNFDSFNHKLKTVSGRQSKTDKPYQVPACPTVTMMFKGMERAYLTDFTNFKARWNRACTESGVHFWLRDLRRTAATHLLLDSVDIVTIQKLLGHSSVKMTEAYLSPSPKISHEAVKSLEEKFRKIFSKQEYAFNEN